MNSLFSSIDLFMYQFGSAAGDIVGKGAREACPASTCGNGSINGLFSSVTKLLLFIIGAIAILMVIIGGLRYVLSAGDPKATAGAKDTILYAIVGLVLAVSAYAIVSFVTSHV